MNEPKMSERMQAIRKEAEVTIKSMLWAGDDETKIAETALRGGLDPLAVDRIAAAVREARAALEAGEAAQAELPTHAEAVSKAASAANKAAAKLAAAQSADAEARDALAEAEASLAAGESIMRGALNAAISGAIPANKIPSWLAAMAAEARAADERQKAASAAAMLKHGLRSLRDEVERLEALAARDAATGDAYRERIVTPGGLARASDMTAARLKTLRAQMVEAEKKLAALERQAA